MSSLMWPIQPLCVATMDNSIIKPQAPKIGKSLRGFVPIEQQPNTDIYCQHFYSIQGERESTISTVLHRNLPYSKRIEYKK